MKNTLDNISQKMLLMNIIEVWKEHCSDKQKLEILKKFQFQLKMNFLNLIKNITSMTLIRVKLRE